MAEPKTRPTGVDVQAFLAAVRAGVSCIDVRRLADVDEEVLRRLVKRVWMRPDGA